jgi:hypothetical protein
MNSKMNVIIATLFLVFTSMMQMNGVDAANSKLRGADTNRSRGKINRRLVGLAGCPLKMKDVVTGGSCGDQLVAPNAAKNCYYDDQGDLGNVRTYNNIDYKSGKIGKSDSLPQEEGSTKCVCEDSVFTGCF